MSSLKPKPHVTEPYETIEKHFGFEHEEIGKITHLHMDELRVLTLPNGVTIKFEEIIALAGDFYGLPKQPIIDPLKEKDQEDSGRHQRFTDAYNTLARAPKDELQKELDKLLDTLKKESEEGESIDAKTWDEVTGGKWFFGLPVKQGRMLQLAENNHDHFLPYAEDAYLAGHHLAINKAREAGEYLKARQACNEYCGEEEEERFFHEASRLGTFVGYHLGDDVFSDGDVDALSRKHRLEDEDKHKRLLHEAFSLDAFACHFLTDCFASGHMRTPRVELGRGTTLEEVGHLLCKYMHDEDNTYGLHVTNKRGDKWVAYGDGMLLKAKSRDNLKIVAEAVQRSAKQVHKAYRNPTKTLDPAVVTELIPFVDQEERNNSPLFQLKDGKLHRRSDISDLQDKETITDWMGPTTIAMLQFYKPKNSAI